MDKNVEEKQNSVNTKKSNENNDNDNNKSNSNANNSQNENTKDDCETSDKHGYLDIIDAETTIVLKNNRSVMINKTQFDCGLRCAKNSDKMKNNTDILWQLN